MKCVVCGERKGKRACPAKSAVICTQCCGEKRVLEIQCPEECEFLKLGRERDSHRNAQHAPSDPAKIVKYRRVVAENQELIARIEYAVGGERISSRDLQDKHVAEALDLLLRTLRSEDSGVLYEQTSEDMIAEGLRRQLRDIVEELRRPKESADPYALAGPRQNHLKLSAAIESLEFLREVVRAHMENPRSDRGYAERLARLIVRPNASEAAPSIIIPGR